MILFWGLSALMIAAAVALVLLPLLRRRAVSDADTAVDIDLHRRRYQELAAEHDAGLVDDDALERARLELARALLWDLGEAPEAPARSTQRHWIAASAVLVAVPAAALSLYFGFGRWDMLQDVSPEAVFTTSPEKFPMVIDSLARRAREHPQETAAWRLLGRSYFAVGRLEDALEAYRRGLTLEPRDPDLLVDYAEGLGVAADRNLQGRPLELIERALSIDPDHGKALWLAGIAAKDAGDYRQAVDYWERLRPRLSADDENAAVLARNIAAARAKLEPVQAGAGARIAVRVRLAPELASRAPAEARVFVFARALGGPPMPIAVRTLAVAQLPATVVLDESAAMVRGSPLSSYEQVTVSARISRAGQAIAKAGDLEGSTGPVPVSGNARAEVVIDRLVP